MADQQLGALSASFMTSTGDQGLLRRLADHRIGALTNSGVSYGTITDCNGWEICEGQQVTCTDFPTDCAAWSDLTDGTVLSPILHDIDCYWEGDCTHNGDTYNVVINFDWLGDGSGWTYYKIERTDGKYIEWDPSLGMNADGDTQLDCTDWADASLMDSPLC